jgi:hypothetical protein
MQWIRLFIALWVLCTTPAEAEYMAYGIGVLPCLKWEDLPEEMINSWILGFFSGTNYANTHTKNIAPGASNGSLTAAVKIYCYQNPTSSISDATAASSLEFFRATNPRTNFK